MLVAGHGKKKKKGRTGTGEGRAARGKPMLKNEKDLDVGAGKE